MSNMLRKIKRQAFREKYGKRMGEAWRKWMTALRVERERARRAEMRRLALETKEIMRKVTNARIKLQEAEIINRRNSIQRVARLKAKA